MSWNLLQGADAFTNLQVFTPIPRVGGVSTGAKGGKSVTVMELLRFETAPTDSGDNTLPMNMVANATTAIATLSTGVAPTTIPVWANPAVFAYLARRHDMTTSGATINQFPMIYDFCNKDGKGFLFAADSFNFSVESNGIGTGLNWGCKLFYRFVKVTLEEYVGIVQSQSQS